MTTLKKLNAELNQTEYAADSLVADIHKSVKMEIDSKVKNLKNSLADDIKTSAMKYNAQTLDDTLAAHGIDDTQDYLDIYTGDNSRDFQADYMAQLLRF